jgi:formamidopyrimidine-DNA glycosylase
MPELPEVETIVRGLRPKISGKTIHKVQILWPPTVEADSSKFQEKLRNQEIQTVGRRGKYICIHLGKRFLLTVHLRMSGNLTLKMQTKERKHLRVKFDLSDRSSLYFVDIRKFGRMRIWTEGEIPLPTLGPEPNNEDTIRKKLSGLSTRRTIKSVLLDQRVLAGLGNIYVDEILFAGGVHPATTFPRLSGSDLERIARLTPLILETAIENMGTTLVNYRPPDQLTGNNQNFLKVYGREGEPCFVCGTAVSKIKLSGRGTHFCPLCQAER